MTILITGSEGYIGSSLLKYYLEKEDNSIVGYDIVAQRNFSPAYSYYQKKDISIDELIKQYKPEKIFNCAGNPNIQLSFTEPFQDFISNAGFVSELLTSVVHCNYNPKIIMLSSAAVYGNPCHLPIKEDMELKPISPYGYNKMLSEEICKMFINLYNLDISIARIFSVFGIGFKRQVVWDLINKSIDGQLSVYGTGKESRDFIYIDDLINCLDILSETKGGDVVYNVAAGQETTIEYITEIIDKCSGKKLNWQFSMEKRKGDPNNWCADISRIKKLGYTQDDSFEKRIAQIYNWVVSLR